MERKDLNLIQDLCKWQEEGKDKRAVIVLTLEVINETKEQTEFSLSEGISGQGRLLVELLKGTFKDSPDLVRLVKKACSRLDIEQLTGKVHSVVKDIN